MKARTLGSLVDALGATIDGSGVADDDLVDGCVVILRTQGDDGCGLVMTVSDGMDWVTQTGMLEAARSQLAATTTGREW